MTKKYVFEIEAQCELDKETLDELLCRLAAQLEDGIVGIYWKYDLYPKVESDERKS